MKTPLLLLALSVSVLCAAEPQPSFVWQGRKIIIADLEKVDEVRAKLADGTIIPLSAVPPLLRAGIAPIPPTGTLIAQKVLQILPDGLLLSKDAFVTRTSTVIYDPVFLRGYPGVATLDRTLACYAEPEGQYTYTTLRGEVKTVDAWKWTGWPQARPSPPPLLPGSKITGSSLDRK